MPAVLFIQGVFLTYFNEYSILTKSYNCLNSI